MDTAQIAKVKLTDLLLPELWLHVIRFLEVTDDWTATLWLCTMLNIRFPQWACPTVTVELFKIGCCGVTVTVLYPKRSDEVFIHCIPEIGRGACIARTTKLGFSMENQPSSSAVCKIRWSQQLYARLIRDLEQVKLIAAPEFFARFKLATRRRAAGSCTEIAIREMLTTFMLHSDVLVNGKWPARSRRNGVTIGLDFYVGRNNVVIHVQTWQVARGCHVELSHFRRHFPYTITSAGELQNASGETIGSIEGTSKKYCLYLGKGWPAATAALAASLAGRKLVNLRPETARLLELCDIVK